MTSLPPLEGPPIPLYCEYSALGPTYKVIFDCWLAPGALSLANFDLTYGDNDKVLTTAEIFQNEVRLQGTTDVTFSPPNGISYHATPEQIFGSNGLPTPAFVKLPFQ